MSDIEALKASILREREQKSRSKHSPNFSPLKPHIDAILKLRGEGSAFDEISRALLKLYGIKASANVLSRYVIRHRERQGRMSKNSAPNPTSPPSSCAAD